MKRLVAEIPENRRAVYEWKDVQHALPAVGDVVCVSVPGIEPPRAIAEFKDGKFLFAFDESPCPGVTFWCHLPMTPEDMRPVDRPKKIFGGAKLAAVEVKPAPELDLK
jgi:hypothetical protein